MHENDLRAQHLVETDWLAQRIAEGDDSLRVVDMRGRVELQTEPDGTQISRYLGAREEYEQGHIPGAIYLDWTKDIVDENDPVPVQMASFEKLARVFAEAGIGNEHLVVAYDAHPASQFATRLWWVLRTCGHTNVRVLNGGWSKWVREGKPISQEKPHYPQASFVPNPQPQWRISADELRDLLGTNVQILDARDEGQYLGKIRRGPRGGRIPGAISLPRERLIGPDGCYLPTEELCKIVQDMHLSPDAPAIAYCNGGVAATTVLFALSMLGYSNLKNYDGSWNEWSQRFDLPVEEGSEEQS